MTIKEIRNLSGLSQAAFSAKYNIPIATIKKWEAPRDNPNYRECPSYVNQLLERAVRYDLEVTYQSNTSEGEIYSSEKETFMIINDTNEGRDVKNVVSTMAIERMFLTKSFVKELLKVSKGEKTSEELRQEVIKKYAR